MGLKKWSVLKLLGILFICVCVMFETAMFFFIGNSLPVVPVNTIKNEFESDCADGADSVTVASLLAKERVKWEESMMSQERVKIKSPKTRIGEFHDMFDNSIMFEKDVLSIYQLYKDVHEVFSVYNISYWLSFGSLLGALRHGGQIPWDDDADVGCLARDKYRVKELVEKVFKPMGYAYKRDPTKFDYLSRLDQPHTCGSSTKSHIHYCKIGARYPFINIFFYEEEQLIDKTNLYVKFIAGSDSRMGLTNMTFNEVFPLKKVKFGDMCLNVPNKSVRVLRNLYGENWNREFSFRMHGQADWAFYLTNTEV